MDVTFQHVISINNVLTNGAKCHFGDGLTGLRKNTSKLLQRIFLMQYGHFNHVKLDVYLTTEE